MHAPIEPRDVYLPDHVYDALKNKLAELVGPLDKPGTDAETEVIWALGEVGGVWPEHIRGDVEALA